MEKRGRPGIIIIAYGRYYFGLVAYTRNIQTLISSYSLLYFPSHQSCRSRYCVQVRRWSTETKSCPPHPSVYAANFATRVFIFSARVPIPSRAKGRCCWTSAYTLLWPVRQTLSSGANNVPASQQTLQPWFIFFRHVKVVQQWHGFFQLVL